MFLKITLAMIAFAANSVLCRLALAGHQIDPLSFSVIRVCSGAVVLLILWLLSQTRQAIQWNLYSALALATYMMAFSYAYIQVDAGVGALLLFGTVQLAMVLYAVFHGEKLNLKRGLGLIIALMGIVILLLPGASAPSLSYSVIMMISGFAWAVYSILGKKMLGPLSSSVGNFLLAVPLVVIGYCILYQGTSITTQGVVLAMLSGGVTSAGAYVLWYSIVKRIDRIDASTVQLSVPCLAILGGALFIGETIGLRLVLSTIIVLLGIFLVIYAGKNSVKENK
ncbi:EamA family transporter [Acinetobacter sp. ANC 4470]|uniref:DMT family transporter n=1 Tax=Acinetobacter sp. ANC 4470 TaxID=1977881 RepID=UPI000A32E2AB|nr:DMT family transporter [Acinetobacter sp. ANC 4470]OTG69137.1 EamA family transporter [Acinetobacter sp. ANC 4470]